MVIFWKPNTECLCTKITRQLQFKKCLKNHLPVSYPALSTSFVTVIWSICVNPEIGFRLSEISVVYQTNKEALQVELSGIYAGHLMYLG